MSFDAFGLLDKRLKEKGYGPAMRRMVALQMAQHCLRNLSIPLSGDHQQRINDEVQALLPLAIRELAEKKMGKKGGEKEEGTRYEAIESAIRERLVKEMPTIEKDMQSLAKELVDGERKEQEQK